MCAVCAISKKGDRKINFVAKQLSKNWGRQDTALRVSKFGQRQCWFCLLDRFLECSRLPKGYDV